MVRLALLFAGLLGIASLAAKCDDSNATCGEDDAGLADGQCPDGTKQTGFACTFIADWISDRDSDEDISTWRGSYGSCGEPCNACVTDEILDACKAAIDETAVGDPFPDACRLCD